MNPYQEDVEAPEVALRAPIDINELRNQFSAGVSFEVKGDMLPEYQDKQSQNTYFHTEGVPASSQYEESEDEDDDEDLSPFEKMAKKMVDVCPAKDDGVLKKILRQGSGPIVPLSSLVRVHFNAYLEYADEPFDCSRLRNQVKKFRLGEGEVLEGWDIGVSTMRKGEVARLMVKPLYAYGHYGSPPRIPQDATIVYEIELLSFVEQAGLEDYFNMTQEEKRAVSFEDLKKVHTSLRKEAKQLFEAKQISRAFEKYRKATSVLEDRAVRDKAEETEQQKLLLGLYLNMSLCLVKQCHSGRAISYCKQALEIDPKNTKALYLCGKALHQLSEFDRALGYLKRAQKVKPQDKDINAELEKIHKDMRNFRLVEKDMYGKMFSKPAGQSAEEKAAEDARIDKAEKSCVKCSDEFRKTVHEKLEEFKTDKDLLEFPMPSYNFTIGEIECILETAEELDLDYSQKGSGQNASIRIIKKQPVPF